MLNVRRFRPAELVFDVFVVDWQRLQLYDECEQLPRTEVHEHRMPSILWLQSVEYPDSTLFLMSPVSEVLVLYALVIFQNRAMSTVQREALVRFCHEVEEEGFQKLRLHTGNMTE